MRLILILSVLALLASCDKKLDISIPFEGERLHVFGKCSIEDGIYVQLSHTLPAVGNYTFEERQEAFLNHATIEVLEDGFVVDTLHSRGQRGEYISNTFEVKEGRRYAIKARAVGFPDIESEEVFVEPLPQFQIIDIETLTEEERGLAGVDFRILLNIDKLSNENKFYAIRYKKNQESNNINPLTVNELGNEAQQASCDMDVVDDENREEVIYLSDRCFNGNSFAISLGFSGSNFIEENGRFIRVLPSSIVFNLSKIGEGYFEFLKSSYLPEGIEVAFLDYPITYSNIKGGYGFFEAESRLTTVLRIPQ